MLDKLNQVVLSAADKLLRTQNDTLAFRGADYVKVIQADEKMRRSSGSGLAIPREVPYSGNQFMRRNSHLMSGDELPHQPAEAPSRPVTTAGR
jgi:hypothetical protein